MRHSAARSLLERDDVIIVASVSCIVSYEKLILEAITFKRNCEYNRDDLIRAFVNLQYKETIKIF